MSARAFLQKYTGVSLNLWRKIKQSESFRLNGVLVNPALTEVHPGDVISYELIEHSRLEPMAPNALQMAMCRSFLLLPEKGLELSSNSVSGRTNRSS